MWSVACPLKGWTAALSVACQVSLSRVWGGAYRKVADNPEHKEGGIQAGTGNKADEADRDSARDSRGNNRPTSKDSRSTGNGSRRCCLFPNSYSNYANPSRNYCC